MTRNNLVQKTITDKNGVVSSRWVKPASDSTGLSVIPAPALVDSSSSNLEHRLDRVIADQNLIIADPERLKLLPKIRIQRIKVAREKNDGDLLRTYADVYAGSDFDPRNLDHCIELYRSSISEDINGSITIDHVSTLESFREIVAHDRYGDMNEEIKRRELVDDCMLMVMRGDVPMERVQELLNRGLRDFDQIKGMLSESEGTHPAVSGGFL